MRRRTIFILLLLLNAVALAAAWEQPDCAASMECRGTTTIPESLAHIVSGTATFMVIPNVVRNMDRAELMEKSLTREELDELKPSTEEMFENTNRATTWYNEAVWTAARGFVLAAEKSDEFRESFVNDEQREKEMDWGDEETTIEVDAWRDVMKEEVPEYHERVMGIGLSAFQGGNAEQVARRVLENES